MADALTDEKIRLAAEIRSIHERDMGQPQRAFLAAAQAFAQNVDRPGARQDLERLARVTGSYEELAATYERVSAETRGPDPDKVSWLRRAAELREHLAQSDESIKDWQALLAEAPQDRQALDALGKLFEQTKNAKQLSDVTLRKAQLASDPHERRALLLKAGEALEAASDSRPSTASMPGASASRSRPTCWRSWPPPPPGKSRRRISSAGPSCSSGRSSTPPRSRATPGSSPSPRPNPTRSPVWSG